MRFAKCYIRGCRKTATTAGYYRPGIQYPIHVGACNDHQDTLIPPDPNDPDPRYTRHPLGPDDLFWRKS